MFQVLLQAMLHRLIHLFFKVTQLAEKPESELSCLSQTSRLLSYPTFLKEDSLNK